MAQHAATGPRRQLSPMPAKPHKDTGRQPYNVAGGEVAPDGGPPASLKGCMSQTVPAAGMQPIICIAQQQSSSQTAEAMQTESAGHQLCQHTNRQHQQHLEALLPPALWQNGGPHSSQQCTPQVGWDSILPGSLGSNDEPMATATSRQGSKSSNAARLAAEGQNLASMPPKSSSSPDLMMYVPGPSCHRSHEPANQQSEQSIKTHMQMFPGYSSSVSCSSSAAECSIIGVTPGPPCATGSAAGTKSRLGRVTGSDGPESTATVASTPRVTQYSCAGGCNFTQDERSWSHSREGGANWGLHRENTSCSLMSSEAAQQLRIHIATFNMAGKVPPALPPAMLGQLQPQRPEAMQEQVDLYVFASQESGSITDWERLIAASLPARGSYERLAWQTLRGIHLVLFASHRARRQVLGIRGSAVATGIGNIVGNKGAVAISLQLAEYKLLFIGSHFAAHDDKVARRNADFHRIRAGLFSGGASSNNLAELGVTWGGHVSNSTGTTPVQGGTLMQKTGPGPMENVNRCTAKSQCAKQCEAMGGASHNSTQQQAGGGRARSSSPAGWWLSSYWGTAGKHSAIAGNERSTDMSPSPSECSEQAAAGPGTECVGNEVYKLRAASCPSVGGNCHGQQHCSQLGSTMAAPQREMDILHPPPAAWPVAGTNTGVGSGEYDAPSECSSGHESHAPGNLSDHSGHSIADEVRSQLSVFKSFLATKASAGSSDATADHDVVFWVGDLNYRINGNSKAVGYLLRTRLHEVLHANDQLRLQQKRGKVFQGYQEGKIHFPPTFKFVQGSSDYSEQRVPSWTDRILWKVHTPDTWAEGPAPSVEQMYYHSVPEITSSDHKPVVAGFNILMTAAEIPCAEHDSRSMRSRCSIM